MNLEAERLISATEKKKDSLFATFQDKLRRGLYSLGEVISAIMTSETIPAAVKASLTPKAADSAKMLCEVHHLLSNHRKHQVYPYMSHSTQKLAEEVKRDTMLFGSDFSDKCKAVQTVEKTVLDIKARKPVISSKRTFRTSSYFLNSQRQVPRTKIKTTNAFRHHRKKNQDGRHAQGRTARNFLVRDAKGR